MNKIVAERAPNISVAKVVAAFAGIYLIWGTTYLAIALSIKTLPPFTSGGTRFLLAAALLFIWLRLREAHPFASVNWKQAAICGVLLTGFGNGLVVWAQQGVPSGIASLLVASIPIFVLAIEWLFFAGKLPSVRASAGMIIAATGVVAIVLNSRSLAGSAKPIYVAAILLAVISWSFGTLLQRRAGVASDRILAFTCAQVFFGSLAQWAMAGINGEWRALDLPNVSWVSIGAMLYLVVFGSIVALSCYSWLLTKIAAQKVATYALVNPVVAVLLGALVLDESLSALAIASALAVLVGIALVLFPVKPPSVADAADEKG